MKRKPVPHEFSSPACFMHENAVGSTSIYDIFNSSAPHALPALPYEFNALEPVISASTLRLHHGEHHSGYVAALNKLVRGTPYSDMTLEQIIKATAGNRTATTLFNSAAEAWNHTFYWHSLRPPGHRSLPSALFSKINAAFGGIDGLKNEIVAGALRQIGSGWVWLVIEGGELRVMTTGNADNPIARGLKPLLAIDVWEHAYYFDYHHRRDDHVNSLFDKLINWQFAAENLACP
jgi:Fe-Mn family superoxide dismutase